MSLEGKTFCIRPQIEYAMNGEFSPPSDPNTPRTLAQLAIATYTNGIYRLPLGTFDPLFTYELPWAPGVTAMVEARYLTHQLLELATLDLEDTAGNGLTISDETDHQGVEDVVLMLNETIDPDNYICYDLIAGKELNIAKADVTKAAQEFFAAQA